MLFDLSSSEKAQVNEWAGYFSHKPTWIFGQFINCPAKSRCWFTGNQFGKNANVAMEYVMRILGIHPIEEKNMRPDTVIRTIRFASQTLPNDPEGGEIRNTQYPAFKKWLPLNLIKKDITIRKPVMTLYDPQGGPDIHVEFTGYNQDVLSQAGVQRWSIWLDESAPWTFFDEQRPRLFAADGDMIVSLTPAEYLGWEFDEFFEKANTFYRTQAICDRLKERTGKMPPRIETTDSKLDIVVFQAATDDNPTLDKKVLNARFQDIDDPDVLDIRRYGIFKQVSGTIFKDFDMRTHVKSKDEYFPAGLPHNWMMGRFADYHEHNPWAIAFLTVSPENEVFVFNEMAPSPEKMVTLTIADEMIHLSGDYKFRVNLIDPLAAKKQTNTGQSVIDDLNRIFSEFKRAGHGTGGYWESWDTKSTRGRDEIRTRLKNSRIVGTPFNNKIIEHGRVRYLPTLWILDNCRQTALSMKNWRKEEWKNREALITKDAKDKPQQKWSHFNMCIEAAFKHTAFRPLRVGPRDYLKKPPKYFQGKK